LIDIHFHCLPGLDDGPANWSEAVALCRAAADQGVTRLVATPHVFRGDWINEDVGARDELLLRLNTLLEGRPAVLPGCEYLFSTEALTLLDHGENGPLTGLNRSRYLLVELPAEISQNAVESAFHEFGIAGVVPVIAHPERHPGFRREPERLTRLVARGARCQLTAASLLGDFGETAASASEEFFRRGLVHFVASDAHGLLRRPPRLAQAREYVRRNWGDEAEKGLFEANPEALLASEPIPWAPSRSGPARAGATGAGPAVRRR
jgi:protein-tyrosine phosphatase